MTLDSVNSIRESYGYFFDIFELISVAIFTLDLFVRIWTAPLEYSNKDETNFRSRIRYLLSFGGIIDVVSILPFYLQAIFPGADTAPTCKPEIGDSSTVICNTLLYSSHSFPP